MEKTCSVCAKDSSPYKCPKCAFLYCSVACCKVHKETCASEQASQSQPQSESQSPAQSNTSQSNMSLRDKLSASTRLQSLLTSSPYLSTHLPVLLARIDRHDPASSIPSANLPSSQLARDLEKKERIVEVLREAVDTDPKVAELYQILLDEGII